MTIQLQQIPTGPTEKYTTSQDLLSWMMENFKQYGDIYRASIYGSDVYVVSSPQYADYILRENWQNYKKGQAIKRIGLLLGNGLMVCEGEFWKKQRRMIQPAFHQEAIVALINVITEANAALLKKWECAAMDVGSVNITLDISQMVLEVVLISLFGDDYTKVAPHFSILSSKSARPGYPLILCSLAGLRQPWPTPDGDASVFSWSEKMHWRGVCPGRDANPRYDDCRTASATVLWSNADGTGSWSEFAQ